MSEQNVVVSVLGERLRRSSPVTVRFAVSFVQCSQNEFVGIVVGFEDLDIIFKERFSAKIDGTKAMSVNIGGIDRVTKRELDSEELSEGEIVACDICNKVASEIITFDEELNTCFVSETAVPHGKFTSESFFVFCRGERNDVLVDSLAGLLGIKVRGRADLSQYFNAS